MKILCHLVAYDTLDPKCMMLLFADVAVLPCAFSIVSQQNNCNSILFLVFQFINNGYFKKKSNYAVWHYISAVFVLLHFR